MTLKNCSDKKLNPFVNMLLFTFKKNIGFTAIATLISFIFSPVLFWNMANNELEYDNTTIYDLMNEFDWFAPLMAIGCCAFAVVLLIINFNFLNSRKGTDAFHALPLTRTELFFARFIPCYICSLIPLTVSYIGYMALSALPGITADIPFIIPAYFYTALMILMLCAFSCIFIMATGCVFDTVVSIAAVNIGVPIAIMLIGNMRRNRLFGFVGYSYETDAFIYGTPFGYAYYMLNKYIYSYDESGYSYTGGSSEAVFTVWQTVITVAVIAVLFAVNMLLYNRRRSERAGEAYAFAFLPNFIAVMIGFIGYYVFGVIFDSGESFFYILMGIIGAVLAVIIYNVISNRGFKKIKKALILAGASIVLTLIINIGIEIDVFGFETYVPKNENIKAASVNIIKSIRVEDDDIKYVTDLHKLIVSDKKNRRDGSENDEMDWIEIQYILKNGDTVERSYFILADIGVEEKSKIVKNCVVPQMKEEFDGNDDNVFELEFYFSKGEGFGTVDIDRATAERLINGYAEDLLNAKSNQFSVIHHYAYMYNNNHHDDAYYFEIPYRNDFKNINAIFEEIAANADREDIIAVKDQ